MEKHAIPHNFMDVEFKLFGNLTVRQFGYIAICSLVALVLYFSGIPRLITIPLIVLMLLLAAALAFLTVNGLPFSRWFSNFLVSLLTPQRKVYKKTAKTPEILKETATSVKNQKELDPAMPVLPSTKRSNYLKAMQALKENDQDDSLAHIVNADTAADSEADASAKLDLLAEQRAASLNKYFQTRVDQNLAQYGLNKKDEVNVIKKLLPNQLAGFVVDKDTKPIENAEVAILDAFGKSVETTYTNSAGKFICPNVVPSGKYSIGVKAEGYIFPAFELEFKDQILPMYRYQAQ
jgi:hypothetical protein